jgi:predicted aspartyl protease
MPPIVRLLRNIDRRRINIVDRMLKLVALPLALLSLGASDPEQTPGKPEAQPATDDFVASLQLGELEQRLTVPVQLNATGPFHFVIDTGAERSVVSRELASHLGLAPGRKVTMTTMTESSVVNTVIVPSLVIPAVGERREIEAPAMEARNLGAAGLLGLDTLEGRRVTIDFDRGTMAVRPARTRSEHNDPDEIVVRARSAFGQLIVTDASYDNTRIRVVIDTGSQVSMGNTALLQRVRRSRKGMQPVTLTSVTGGQAIADYGYVSGIRLGGVEFAALPVAFFDVLPFKRFGLSDKPALLLGMDALRSFRRVDIDFANREVRMLMPRDAVVQPQIVTGAMTSGGRLNQPVTFR